MDYALLDEALQTIKQTWPDAKPVCGLILGSGWSDVADAFEQNEYLDYGNIPGLGTPGVIGHSGRLVLGNCSGLQTFVFQGRRHYYEGEGWTPIALPIYVLKQLGAERVIITNAAGGIRDDLHPGNLMLISDHINMIGANPLQGPHNEIWGPRFPDQSDVYNASLRKRMHQAAASIHVNVSEGIYLAASGPTYETPAEIKSYRVMGADAVGMSTVPEAILANATGMEVGGISCITNYAAGISQTALSHEEVTATTQSAMQTMKQLIQAIWENLSRE